MRIKEFIYSVLFEAKIKDGIATLARSRARKKILKQLENSRHPRGMQIRDALISLGQNLTPVDKDWINRITGERKRLMANNEPLNDGSLGEGGLYDNKKLSIREVYSVSKGRKPALLLYFLTRAVKPLNVIELGTNVGISSAYIAAALKMNDQNGKMITLDASVYRLRLAKEVHRNLGLDNISYVDGLFTDTLGGALEDLGSVDLAFIDGHHQYQPTLDYLNQIFEFSSPDTVFVFDDIRWSEGMEKAWAQIQSDNRLGLLVDLDSVGIGVRQQEGNSQRFMFGPINLF
jgi:predicted O-methyltransferase YrrM